MKLLDKRQIQVEKSTERKTEIEQGLKIARKVDELRQTLAKEQQALTVFREETTKDVRSKIADLVNKKNTLEQEVSLLERRRRELLEPIDKEQQLLTDSKRHVDSKIEELKLLEKSLSLKKDELNTRARDIMIEEERIKDEKKQTHQNLEQSLEKTKEAEKLLSVSRETCNQNEKMYQERIQELDTREANIASIERNQDMRSKYLDSKEVELNNRERIINDKYTLLERTQKRLYGNSNITNNKN